MDKHYLVTCIQVHLQETQRERETEQIKLDKEKLREPNQRHSEKKATFSSENGQNCILVQS
ncbi:hypothetical protein DsansV1_C23g0175721 [Dioscorea sansibarensis]